MRATRHKAACADGTGGLACTSPLVDSIHSLKSWKMHINLVELWTKVGKQVSAGIKEGEGLGLLVVHAYC